MVTEGMDGTTRFSHGKQRSSPCSTVARRQNPNDRSFWPGGSLRPTIDYCPGSQAPRANTYYPRLLDGGFPESGFQCPNTSFAAAFSSTAPFKEHSSAAWHCIGYAAPFCKCSCS